MFSTNLMITRTNLKKKIKNCQIVGTGYKYDLNSTKAFQNFRRNIYFLQWDIYEIKKVIVGESLGGTGCTVGYSSQWPKMEIKLRSLFCRFFVNSLVYTYLVKIS